MASHLTSQIPPRIVGTGLFALDLILNTEGKLVSSALGGSAGNVLAILAGLGWESVPVAKLGDDDAGKYLREEFLHLNADLKYLYLADSSTTPIVYQHLMERGQDKTHRFSFSCPACGHKRSLATVFASEYIAPDMVTNNTHANVLYLDRPTELGVELAEQYRQAGALIVFEPSAVGDDELFNRALKSAHIVKYADDRLEGLEQYSTEDVAVEICTMGNKGLRYRAPSLERSWIRLDAYKAPRVVDTSGAGDWCTAGMLYHLFNEDHSFDINQLDYNNLHRALRFGQALSALNCMTLGARGLAKTLSAKKIAQAGNQLRKLRINATSDLTYSDESCTAELARLELTFVSKLRSDFDDFLPLCCDRLS